ncbi:MAG: glycosyl hydrolase family 28 protein [Chthoniobacteraceae bacterium]|nr:glycosyl hydrolase family 28 protein [Chthoniobacteraceae bacterium]
MITARETYPITEFGAVPDGETNNAVYIQEAIDACAADGGGTVVVPPGTFLSGKIRLLSRVELHLEQGATLLCSGDIDDIHPPEGYRHGIESAFICAEDGEDIAITGKGVIDGNGRAYVAERLPHIYVMPEKRPITFYIGGCKRVTITDITIRDGANWTLWLVGCEDVLIQGIRMYNDLKLPNSDGIDIDRCRNVHITNCHIEAGDDAIVLKTMRRFERYGHSENIIVSGCTLKSTSSAICIGCEIAAPVRNVIFDSCIISSSHRGLSINHSFEANIENVLFSNMFIETRLFHDRWWGRGEPIYVKVLPWTEKDDVGQTKNVRFQNIRARSENGVLVHGFRPENLQGIEFENVHIEMAKWSKWPGGMLDLRPCPGAMDGYEAGVREHPTYAFLLQNAKGVTLRNCGVSWGPDRPDYFKGALSIENIQGLVLEGFRDGGA